jgi:hydrogenase maturation protease
MDRILIIGYGNVDRQDDGVAWHVLTGLAANLGRATDLEAGEGFQSLGASPDLLFQLQLVPELAETIAKYDRVCFIDAHTGNIAEDLHIEALEATYQASVFTHHMTPQTCLALAQNLYGNRPTAWLVSIRGYEFEFDRSLSYRTQQYANQAIELILRWIDTDRLSD